MGADYCGPGALGQPKIQTVPETRCADMACLAYCRQILYGMNMPRKIWIFWLFALCLCMPAAGQEAGAPVVADGFAALVNDRVVTVGDVLSLVQQGAAQRESLYEGEELEQKLKEDFDNALEILIEHALILEDFEQKKAEIPDRAVDDYLESVIRDRFDNDRGAFLGSLAAQRMTLEDYRKEIKDHLIVMVSRQQILQGKIFVPPSAVRHTYEERADSYRLPEQVRYCMMMFKGGKTEEERQARRTDVESIHQQLLAGADFAEMAKEHSEDSRAAQGGDRGWSPVKDLGPQFAEALKSLEPGGVSGVIEESGNFYIVKLEERREASVTPFEEVKEEIEKELRNAEEERIYKEWIDRLRNKYNVKIFKQ